MISHDVSVATSSVRSGLNMRTYRISFAMNTGDENIRKRFKVEECKSSKEVKIFESGDPQGVGYFFKKGNLNKSMKNPLILHNTIKEYGER